MNNKPYVGVASVVDRIDAICLANAIEPNLWRTVAIGVGVSQKTLDGITTKYPNRYVPVSMLKSVFSPTNSLNLVHYNFDDTSRMGDDLHQILQLVPNLGGIQINQPRRGTHDVVDPLRSFADVHRDKALRIILQVHASAFNGVSETLSWIADYVPSITDVLLDVSLGTGRRMDGSVIHLYSLILSRLRSRYPDLGLGVAGGLDGKSIVRIAPLFQLIPDLSIDAEGRLRKDDDTLDFEKAIAYLVRSFNLAAKYYVTE